MSLFLYFLFRMQLYELILIFMTLNEHNNKNIKLMAQLMGGEKSMELFLDRLLHESVYDRRVRPFYKNDNSK